jgi:hypothetical protein
MILRCYWPKKAILDVQWKNPPVERVK